MRTKSCKRVNFGIKRTESAVYSTSVLSTLHLYSEIHFSETSVCHNISPSMLKLSNIFFKL